MQLIIKYPLQNRFDLYSSITFDETKFPWIVSRNFSSRSSPSAANGSPRRMGTHSPMTNRPVSIVDAQIVELIVIRDEKGYGMKVSGDNPVYVQSVKEGKLENHQNNLIFKNTTMFNNGEITSLREE